MADNKGFFRRAGEIAAAGMAIATAMSFAGGLLWLVLKDNLKDVISDMSGVASLADELRADRAATSSTIAKLTEIVADHARRLEEELHPAVVEYDRVRSRVFEPCYAEGVCEAGIFARRTQKGAECAPPKVVRRTVYDISGIPREASGADSTRPSKLSGAWEWRYPRFDVPRGTPIGIAEFELVLDFQCPWGEVVEKSPRFPFQVLPPEAGP